MGEAIDPWQGIFSPTDRDRILRSSTECCAELGYRETTVGDIVDRADVSLEAFHSLFASKEECAIAAVNALTAEVVTVISMTPAPNPEELRDGTFGIKAILDLIASSPARAKLAYIQARQGGTARMHSAYSSGALVLTPMTEGARRFGKAGITQPAGAARAALGGVEAVIRREISNGRYESLRELLPDFVYAVVVPFVGQEEALRQSRLAKELLGK